MSKNTQPLRAAALDLGTNTFQLLVGEKVGDKLTFLHRDERWVNMAEDGIERIGHNAFQRLRDVLTDYRKELERFQPHVVKATGTAAFRRAENSADARALVTSLINVEPTILTGDEEAHRIYNGVRLAANGLTETVLVMDIGGGSTEFIIGLGDKILWKKSYALGATLLRQKFHRSEPIAKNERDAMKRCIAEQTHDLIEAVKQFSPTTLIGASGSFDSFRSMLFHPNVPDAPLLQLSAHALVSLLDNVCSLDFSQRKALPGLIWFRVGPIVSAAVLTDWVVETFGLSNVFHSAYALNEGTLDAALSG